MREAYLGAREGTIDLPRYQELVGEVCRVYVLGCDLFESPVVQTRTSGLPENEARLVGRTQALFHEILGAVRLMQAYLQSGDPQHYEDGFARAEAGIRELATIQEKAMELCQ